MRILQAQDIINDVTFVGACYRFDLMRSRDLQ
jgi:SNF2 family DNA or RNA helicase